MERCRLSSALPGLPVQRHRPDRRARNWGRPRPFPSLKLARDCGGSLNFSVFLSHGLEAGRGRAWGRGQGGGRPEVT